MLKCLLASALALAFAMSLALSAGRAQTIGSGHVLGNGTSTPSSPTDTPLMNVMSQPGSGLGSGIAAALGLPANGAGSFPILDVNGQMSAPLITYQSQSSGAQPNSLASVLENIVIATNYMSAAQVTNVESYTGSLDLTATVNQILANNAGKTVILPAGKWRFASHLSCPAGTTIEGVGWAELAGTTPSEPNVGTVFVQDYLAAADPKGIEATGPHCTVENLEIRQPQPTPGVGWTPNENPWAIYSNPAAYSEAGGHRLTVRNVMLRNVTYGILTDRARGGEFTDIYGQPFKAGIKVTGDGDTSTWRNLQLGWTFWSGDANVLAYQLNHMDGITLGRVDTPMMSNIFVWGAHRGFRTFYDNSHAEPGYNGIATGVKIANIDLDNVGIGLALEDNPEIMISNFRAMPNSAVSPSECIRSEGIYNPGANYGNLQLIINGGECLKPGSPAILFAFDPPGTPLFPQLIKLNGFRIMQPNTGSWSPSSPAISTPSPQATVQAWDITVDNVTDTATILGGSGSLVWKRSGQDFQGNVTAYNFTTLSTNPAWLAVNSAAGSDLKQWNTVNDATGTWHLAALNDAGSAGTDAITITRSGYAPTGIALNAPTTAPTPAASDNSTRVATTAFFVAQFGQPHTWSATQTFAADMTLSGVLLMGASGSIQGNLYYSGGWKYAANGFGSQFAFNNSVGGACLYAAPNNAGGAGAAASPVSRFCVAADGTVTFPAYTTAGTLTNDASGNVATVAGFTGTKTVRASGGASDCTMIFTKGVLTGGSC
ncbi:hypothetical protein EDE12_11213 [Methylosinus sp. sav-2]|uniref:hypothetical protein n=1 Tax=Methylosinus sp. sav-2 TaxID=2485168 RepID=UPI00047A9378|nr:hypothetical protein [Methylosinus sp. sav-2]TDX61912.1 hypothetical protein EDE12_11213 [Methylosinus sp. sav-2]